MNEWYVVSVGYLTASTPKMVILGRVEAVREFTRGFKMTPEEKRRVRLFLEGALCDVGAGLGLVGYTDGDNNENKVADRRLTRVFGPGSEV